MPNWTAIESVSTLGAVGVATFAAWQSNRAASKLTAIESQRRHAELFPRLRVTIRPLNPGANVGHLRMNVMLIGPPGLDRVDRLTMTIRNDHFLRGHGYQQIMDGPSPEEVQAHIWGPYRLTPGTGPDPARADSTGRSITYAAELPIGEELPFGLEHTTPGKWMTGITQPDWLRERGSLIRLAFALEHRDHGRWYLPCEIDVADMPVAVFLPQHTSAGEPTELS